MILILLMKNFDKNVVIWSFLKINFEKICSLCRLVNRVNVCQNLFEPCHEKPVFCICENKDADQLRCNHEADQRLCFRYIDSTIPLLPKYEISSL